MISGKAENRAMPEQQSDLDQYKSRCEEQAALIDSMARTNLALTGTIDELKQTIDGLHGTIDGLHGTIDGLHGTIDELKATIRELQSRLGRNSQNSSQPPSKDGFSKPQPASENRAQAGRPDRPRWNAYGDSART